MKQIIIIHLGVILSLNGIAQNKDKDKEAIKKMCGCFEVGFHFAETFNYSKDSTYKPSKVKHAGALEWAQLVKESDDEVIIQHLLVINGKDKPFIMKHWRQDWKYENTKFYTYYTDNKWKFVKKSKENVSGQWTQKVYQVDDSPRYEGSGSWVYVDGKTYWENVAEAPLPRREYTQRSDYNLTLRRNRHEITDEGWVHDQDNDKILREKDKDIVVAQEKGYNVYKRVSDEKCKEATKWWDENKEVWRLVRKNWTKVFDKNRDLELRGKVEGKRLYSYLFKIDKDTKNKEIKGIIKKFVKP